MKYIDPDNEMRSVCGSVQRRIREISGGFYRGGFPSDETLNERITTRIDAMERSILNGRTAAEIQVFGETEGAAG